MDEQAVLELIEDLKDIDSEVQESVVELLGEIGDRRAVMPLIETLHHWIQKSGVK